MNDTERAERIAAFRIRFREMIERARVERAAADKVCPAPRYDEVFFRGVEWLNRQ